MNGNCLMSQGDKILFFDWENENSDEAISDKRNYDRKLSQHVLLVCNGKENE